MPKIPLKIKVLKGIVYLMNNEFQISNSTGMFSSPTAAQGAVVSFRTSSRNYQSVGCTGVTSSREFGFAGISNKQSSSSESVILGSYSVKRTASFSAIHDEIADVSSIVEPSTSESSIYGPRRNSDRPGDIGDGYTGELIPNPVGDMLLPMLAMAVAYLIVKLFRKRKTSHIL